MADFFSGLSYGDQLEAGLATHGAADPEVWNEMLRKDADEARLAQQVTLHGEGHGQQPLATQAGEGSAPLVQQDVASGCCQPQRAADKKRRCHADDTGEDGRSEWPRQSRLSPS